MWVTQSCPTLWEPMDYSLPGSPVHGIFQARVLEWGAIAFSMTNLDSCIKNQRHHFADKGPSSQSYGFSSSHVWMWELDHKDNWALKNWCFWTVVLEKTLESPLDCKEINKSILKEISPGCSLEGLMLKQKLQYFGHLMRRIDSFKRPLLESSSSSKGISLKGWAVSVDNDIASDSRCGATCLFQASGFLLYFDKSIRSEVWHF